MNKPKLVRVAVTLIAVMLLAGGGYWFYINRPRTVTVTYTQPAPVSVNIYSASKVDEHGTPQNPKGSIISTVNSTSTITLRPGNYVASAIASADYTGITEGFSVRGDGTKITIDPQLTEAALARKLIGEKAAITAAIDARFPGDGTAYKIIDQTLYGRGEWAATIIQITGLSDYFHIMLQKTNSWRVISKPEIVLSTSAYPTVPRSILVKVNQKQFVAPEGERE